LWILLYFNGGDLVIFDRLDMLRKEKGISATFLCAQVGKNRFFIKDCRNGKGHVSDDAVAKWADILDTTPEYLKGETDVKEKPHVDDKRQDSLNRTIGEISHLIEKQKSPNAEAEGLENERALIEEAISMLSESRKRQLLEYARFLAAQEAADHKDDR
jgi:hypothetical protein